MAGQTKWPSRVWEPTGYGLWASRPVTQNDRDRRVVAERELKLASMPDKKEVDLE